MQNAFDEFDDPEQSYRRGYAQGAWDVLDAVKAYLPKDQYEALQAWHTGDFWPWRISGMRRESVRASGPNPFPAGVNPPRDRLPH